MAKFDTLRKLERNQLVVSHYKTHPALSLREIGRVFGVSAQRIWNIVKAHEKRTGRKVVRKAR